MRGFYFKFADYVYMDQLTLHYLYVPHARHHSHSEDRSYFRRERKSPSCVPRVRSERFRRLQTLN